MAPTRPSSAGASTRTAAELRPGRPRFDPRVRSLRPSSIHSSGSGGGSGSRSPSPPRSRPGEPASRRSLAARRAPAGRSGAEPDRLPVARPSERPPPPPPVREPLPRGGTERPPGRPAPRGVESDDDTGSPGSRGGSDDDRAEAVDRRAYRSHARIADGQVHGRDEGEPDGLPFCRAKSGGVLLSQGLSSQVPSALEGLTSVFGMGTGVAPPLWPPKSVVNNERRPGRIPGPRRLEDFIASTNVCAATQALGRLVPVS